MSLPGLSVVAGSPAPTDEGSSFHWSSSARATMRLPIPDSRTTVVSALAVSTGVVTSPANAPQSICLRMNSMT